MRNRAPILFFVLSILFLSISNMCSGQQQFYKQVDTRGFDGDYNANVVKLYPDFTIEIINYVIRGREYNPAFTRTTYIGKYIQKNDTCSILFLKSYYQKKEKYSEEGLKKGSISFDLDFLIVNPIFYVQNGIITSSTWLFPSLPEGSDIEINTVESSFQNWDKPKNAKQSFY